VQHEIDLPEEDQMLLYDPQTSGGLLLAVPGTSVDSFETRMKELDAPCWQVGEVVEGDGIVIG